MEIEEELNNGDRKRSGEEEGEERAEEEGDGKRSEDKESWRGTL